MQVDTRTALLHGLIDAVGFVGGALAGWRLGRWFGFDILAPGPWTLDSLAGWAFLIAGLAGGKWLSMRWRARSLTKQ
ncbi:MAG TPA: hypothetical protein PK306_24925 [Aquabacterium sp.]|nr:hypothetical protein [Aquabacterium sp.]HQC98952.1 hypothetical protein [Aquabacterium sp.]